MYSGIVPCPIDKDIALGSQYSYLEMPTHTIHLHVSSSLALVYMHVHISQSNVPLVRPM